MAGKSRRRQPILEILEGAEMNQRPRSVHRRVGLWLLLASGLAAQAVAAAPWMSTRVFGLPISFEECRSRVSRALAAEGYGKTRDFGNGWLGFTESHSVSAGCIHGSGETVVSLVVASESDNLRELDRLTALIRGDGGSVSGKHLSVDLADGGIIVHWKDTPGNAQDWVSVQPVGSADDSYGAIWAYTQGQRSGSRSFGSLAPGEYEVRLYHDWPNGGFTVRERLRFRVGQR
jgi:hypothetical protein